MFNTRIRATLIHLTISLVVFVPVAWVILFKWFPSFFFTIDGGREGLQILVGVQLVLGPVLTLVLFKPGKPGLKFDLAVVGILQAGCLGAGLYIIHSERPLFFVYYEEQFHTVNADTFTEYGLLVPAYRDYARKSPAWVYVALPDNPIEEADIRRILYQDDVPLWVYSPLYRPLTGHVDDIIARGTSERVIRQKDSRGELDRWLTQKSGAFSDYAFFPVHSRYQNVYLGIRKSDQAFVDILDVAPFHLTNESLKHGQQLR